MTRLLPEPSFRHGTASKAAVLPVNLRTPEAPSAGAVGGYLKEFLCDPRVVEIPRALWLPLLHLVVLNTRPRHSAERYAQVWTPDGSPLKVHTERQAKMLRGYLGERIKAPLEVEWAMRYGKPSIADAMAALAERGCDRLLVVPLYPQYASSTTGSALDALARVLETRRNVPALRFVRHFHDHAGYVGAVAQSVRDYWMKTGRPDRLVMSFHGVPRYTLERGDPYHCECQKTARLVREALGLSEEKAILTFQSRFGGAEWLQPYTSEVLMDLGRRKTGRVDVVCPGFVSDCLETLEEIAIEGRASFLAAGGGEYHYIPCLNERDDWLKALTDLVLKNLLGWVEAPAADALEGARTRALALGAKQ